MIRIDAGHSTPIAAGGIDGHAAPLASHCSGHHVEHRIGHRMTAFEARATHRPLATAAS